MPKCTTKSVLNQTSNECLNTLIHENILLKEKKGPCNKDMNLVCLACKRKIMFTFICKISELERNNMNVHACKKIFDR